MDSLLNVAPCGYLSFKDDGVIVWTNLTLSKWLGYSPDELVGQTVERIFTLATRIFYNTHFFPLVKLNTRVDEIFLSLSTKEKSDIPVLTNAERRLENGIYLIHCVFVPVQQRRKYEDEILRAKREAENALKENTHLQELKSSLEKQTLELDRQYQKLKAMNSNLLQFSKIISHDLQEPLRKIQLFADIIGREQQDTLTAKSKSSIQKINIATERLKALTIGLQQYVTIDAEEIHVAIDLNAIVEKAKSKAIEHRKFEEFDLTYEKLPTILGYPNQLQLLFFHLIDNSIQFREPARRLKIDITSVMIDENLYKASSDKYQYAEHIKINFVDNGIGIENHFKEYVFELLKKINPVISGLGMGLSLVKKIVDNHGGSVHIESKQGEGTKVTIVLPLSFQHKSEVND